MIKKIPILILWFWSFNVHAQPTIFSDTSLINKINIGVNQVYNFQFEDAKNTYNELIDIYPGHPFVSLYDAILLYWEYFPIVPHSDYYHNYVGLIGDVIEKTDVILETNEYNSETVFFNLIARILLLQYYADNGLPSKIIPHCRTSYRLLLEGFDLMDEVVDFHLFTGIYNYYREAYPEAHPIYKPITYFFAKGNKKLGMQQIKHNWQNGVFLEAESLFFLLYINLFFEGNYIQSKVYAYKLYEEYPDNPLYCSYLIKVLLLKENYEEAEILIDKLFTFKHNNGYFKSMAKIYQAILFEKKHRNFVKAEELYQEVILEANTYGDFFNNSLSYVYFGLSRINAQNDIKNSKQLRKQAVNLSNYPNINFD